jgi:predicted PurR-regulated permease PerM
MLLNVFVDPAFAGFALLLAIIAAFSEFIPNFGPWIAAIPAVLIALTLGPNAVVATALLDLVLMFLEGQVLVPKIEGGAFSFHPALVLFLVVAGVALMGILGAILALPVAAAAWRSTRFAFRRASGLPLREALNWSGDEDKGEIVPAATLATAQASREPVVAEAAAESAAEAQP